jgi:hypothetical protein
MADRSSECRNASTSVISFFFSLKEIGTYGYTKNIKIKILSLPMYNEKKMSANMKRLVKRHGSVAAVKKYERDRKARQRNAKREKICEQLTDHQVDVIAEQLDNVDLKDEKKAPVITLTPKKSKVKRNTYDLTAKFNDVEFNGNCQALKQGIIDAFEADPDRKYAPTMDSMNGYFRNIHRVYKLLTGKEFGCTAAEFQVFNDTKATEAVVNNMISLKGKNKGKTIADSTKKTVFTGLAVIQHLGLKKAGLHYSAIATIGDQAIKRTRSENKQTTGPIIRWTDILGNMDKMDTARERFIYALYTMIPPRRPGVFWNLQLGEGINHINLDRTGEKPKATLHLGDYKTVKGFGVYNSDDLPANLVAEIVSYVDSQNVDHGERFFIKTRGSGGYNKGSITPIVNKTMSKAVGKVVTKNAVRKAFDTWFLAKKGLSENIIQAMGVNLGHGANEMRLYRKIDLE